MKKIIFTEEQLQDIKQKYEVDHMSLSKIASFYGVSRSTITRVIKEIGVSIRKDNHTYFADYDKFHIIDTAEKAYWLGFIAADGCVFVRDINASIIINISKKDRNHLEKFKKFMNSNVNIIDHIQNKGFSNNSEMSKITFNSLSMAQDFIACGVPNKKSLILKPPLIESKFFLPFILGYFDGDGSIFEFNNHTEWGINIEGTKEVLEWINNLLGISNKLEKRKKWR